MSIIVRAPKGIAPRFNPVQIGEDQAQTAENCVLESLDCRPLKVPVLSQALSTSTMAVFRIGGQWKEFDNRVSVIPSPVSAGDNRYYFTLASGGGRKADDNISSINLGVSRPSTGPTLTLNGEAGENLLHSTAYLYTRVTAWGEESAPSAPSGGVDVHEGQHITFTGLSDGGSSYVTHYRLYRAVGGAQSNVWMLVPYQITAGVLQYDGDNEIVFDIPKANVGNMKDGLRDDALHVQLETLSWHTPPDDLAHLTNLSNGMVGGISGKEVCFAYPWIPYAWPVGYRYMLDDEGAGMGSIGGVPVAFTRSAVYLFDGSSPDAFHQRKISETQGCESHLSIASTSRGVFFASRDGICLATPRGVDVLTLGVWTREQWSAKSLSNLMGFHFNDAYYGCFLGSQKGFILPLNQQGGSVTTFDLGLTIRGGYLLPSNDRLFLILEDTGARGLYEFDAGDALDAKWKSKKFRQPMVNLGAFKIGGATGSSTVKILADGTEVFAQNVEHNKGVRLPAGFRPQEYEVEISGTVRWHGWGMSNSMKELKIV